jgi:hypothetical protein
MRADAPDVLERWAPPPHYNPPPPVAWLLSLGVPVQVALLCAYWLYLAAAGVMAGLGVAASLIGGGIALALVLASYFAMVEARRREWLDEPRETLWRAVAGLCGGACAVISLIIVVLPAIVVLVLAFWALASVPIWLYRR